MPSASTKLDYSDLPAILWLQNAERYFNYIFPCDQFCCHILWLKSYWNALNRTKTSSAILPHRPSSPLPKVVQVVWMEMLLLSKRLLRRKWLRWTVPTGTLHSHSLGFSQSMCISQRKWKIWIKFWGEAVWMEPSVCWFTPAKVSELTLFVNQLFANQRNLNSHGFTSVKGRIKVFQTFCLIIRFEALPAGKILTRSTQDGPSSTHTHPEWG